jgi:hypothetical protein
MVVAGLALRNVAMLSCPSLILPARKSPAS